MTDLPKSPDLLELPALWLDWLRELDNEQVAEARKRIIDWELKEHGIKLSALERIKTMIETEMVRRFVGMVGTPEQPPEELADVVSSVGRNNASASSVGH